MSTSWDGNEEVKTDENDKTNIRPTESQMCTAAGQGRLFLVRKYIHSDNPLQETLDKALYKAVQNGRSAVINELLKANANPNKFPNIIVACQKGYTRILGYLLEHGAD